MTIRLVPRFPVDDLRLSALHARAFGGDPATVQPWAQRLERHALTWIGAFDARLVRAVADEVRAAGCEWLHVDFEAHPQHFYLDNCGFRTTHAGLMHLGWKQRSEPHRHF